MVVSLVVRGHTYALVDDEIYVLYTTVAVVFGSTVDVLTIGIVGIRSIHQRAI